MEFHCFNEKWKEIKLSDEEEKYYIEKAKEITDRDLENIVVKYDSDNQANIYHIPNSEYDDFFYNIKFERIRRITGYLTGNLDTWNKSKRAEERDRVKHK